MRVSHAPARRVGDPGQSASREVRKADRARDVQCAEAWRSLVALGSVVVALPWLTGGPPPLGESALRYRERVPIPVATAQTWLLSVGWKRTCPIEAAFRR